VQGYGHGRVGSSGWRVRIRVRVWVRVRVSVIGLAVAGEVEGEGLAVSGWSGIPRVDSVQGTRTSPESRS
jgi:hypothetical protein